MLKEIYYWMIYHLKKIGTTELTKTLSIDRNIVGIVFGLSIMIPNYFFLYAKREEIYAKYEQLPKERRIKGIIFFWIYSIISFPLFFILGANLIR